MHVPDQLLDTARGWMDAGHGVALATVVETWGSAPCPVGSQMVINNKAGFAGSVSGGCIETSVVSESLEIISEGGHELLFYGVSDEESYAAGLACGGNIRVYVEPLTPALMESYGGKRPFVRAIDLESGQWRIVGGAGDLDLSAEDVSAIGGLTGGGRAQRRELSGRDLFLHPVTPPLRLILIGAVRIAQALAPMAREAGFEVVVVDPRRAFCTEERFPGTTLVREWPNEALPRLGLDSGTALVTLVHDAKPDDMALEIALRSDAFYVGSLGSKTTHGKRVTRLKDLGLDDDEIGRIHAPVGLDIKAGTPPEIAVSILAQVIAAKNSRSLVA